MKIAIIADDLTGANDSGVQLVNRGISTAVYFHRNVSHIFNLSKYEAMVFDTDSRSDTSDEAYNKVRSICSAIQSPSLEMVYKKIDSTMRGNIGVEIDAIYDEYQPDFVVIAPSYPENGRTIKNGYLYIEGELLHQTDISQDPKTPINDSYLPKLLSEQTNRAIALISQHDSTMGRVHVQSKITKLKEAGIPYLLFDAETTEELKQIVNIMETLPFRVIWCGSAGLANVLPLHWESSTRLPSSNRFPAGQVLTVVGSVNSRTRRQLKRLLESTEIVGIELNAQSIVSGDARDAERNHIYSKAIEALQAHKDLVIYSSGSLDDIDNNKYIGHQEGMNAKEISNRISAALGQIAAEIIQKCHIAKLVLTGGDTAKQVCLSLGASELELLGEIDVGVPLCRIAGKDTYYVITKAGGFGDDLALLKFLNFYRDEVWTWDRSSV